MFPPAGLILAQQERARGVPRLISQLYVHVIRKSLVVARAWLFNYGTSHRNKVFLRDKQEGIVDGGLFKN
jgi:hypothetical protein